jgi:hypothetical protein
MTLKDKKMDIDVQPAMVQHPTGREHRVTFTLWGWETEQLRQIMIHHLPEWARLFASKNAEYGAGNQASGTALGQRGQFADIWRKIGKLKTGIWDGNEDQLTSESVDEILLDLIGHCFLALHMRRQEDQEKKTPGLSFTIIDDSGVVRLRSPLGGEGSSRISLKTLEEQHSRVKERLAQDWIEDGGYTAESYSMGDGVWISKDDTVRFRQHLRQGGTYKVLGFNSRRGHGMIAHIVKQVDLDQPTPEPTWTNPDWLEIENNVKEEGLLNDPEKFLHPYDDAPKGCPEKLTVEHIMLSTRRHLINRHAGEAIPLS